MSRNLRVRGWLLHALTLIFLWGIKRQRLHSVEEVEIFGEPERVWKIHSKKPLFAQVTPVGTIIWNEARMSKLSEEAKSLVLSHERSHQERNAVFKGLFWGMLIVSCIAIGHLISIGLVLIMGYTVTGLENVLPIYSGIILIFGILWRLEEFFADQHAIESVGESAFKSAKAEIGEYSADSIFANIFRKLIYTDTSTTVKIYRKRQKSSLLP